jgi:glycerol-3-phosphate cytidylyltransferase
MLQYAKGLGDRLIVAVSTDELVEQYKGKKTMIPFEERIAIVGALKCVDVCVPQEDRDKFKAWERIGFDIWVVGDDWFGNEYYMDIKAQLAEVKVRSVFFPYAKGLNSTLRREKLQSFR